jgi:5'-3' exonuclease
MSNLHDRERKDKVLLIDGDHIIYVVCPNKKLKDRFGNDILDENGSPQYENKTLQECKDLCDNYLDTLFYGLDANYYLGFLTVGRCFRYRIKEDYKANRKDLVKPPHFDAIKEYLIVKYKFLYDKDLYEADDMVMLYKNYLFNNNYDIIIVSTDKDVLGQEGKYYNHFNKKWFINTKEEANYKFWLSMLTGDVVDNIKGIPKIGIKKGEKILKKQGTFYSLVLDSYVNYYGVDLGIEEFYKNYKCLKIVDVDSNYKFKELIKL